MPPPPMTLNSPLGEDLKFKLRFLGRTFTPENIVDNGGETPHAGAPTP